MQKKSIVLVDDHVVVRNGLKALIEKLGPYEVVREFDSGTDYLFYLKSGERPDLTLMDLSMPEMGGLEVMKKLQVEQIRVPVLILTLNEEEDLIIQLFRLGARAYLTKNSSSDTMKQALEEIFRSGYFHNEFLQLSLERNPSFSANGSSVSERLLERISPREREFLKLVCHEAEYTYEQIASLMNVNQRTVDGYRQSLFEKFAIKSKTGLVLFILKHRLYEKL